MFTRQHIQNFVVLFVMSLVLVGCATKRVGEDQMLTVKRYAAEVFRNHPSYVLMPIGTKGEEMDSRVLRTRSLFGHPSVPAEQLARSIALAEERDLCMAVTGVSSTFAAAIVVEALSLSDVRLPKLSLLFVGDIDDKESVRLAVEKRGGKFYFRPL